mmetsp:Transcript_24653/g.58546  ORF Transcript_24653/g.58546 Transcript_24653/m.58546 type:complete len:346 (+) Transcript_24653:295-1332(+)
MAKSKKRPAQRDEPHGVGNPLQEAQAKFMRSVSNEKKAHFFDSTKISPEERAEIWERQADIGEKLVDSYAWATPDHRCLEVFKHFGPIVEVGCGTNAYWANWMHNAGVDVVALDLSLDSGGGKINKVNKNTTNVRSQGGCQVLPGGPASLSENKLSSRTLFLCYPDEEDTLEEEESEEPMSMAAQCLEHFSGDTIIYVGEFFGDTLSMDQAPFGRSSSGEFQVRLAGEFHCILKMRLLNNWIHVRDTLSVWKRSKTCCLAFEGSEDEESDSDEVYYKNIPPSEALPVDAAAPCVAHLLRSPTKEPHTSKTSERHATAKKKRNKKNRPSSQSNQPEEHDVIAGEAW